MEGKEPAEIVSSTSATSRMDLEHMDQLSLCEVLDRTLNAGAVVAGEVRISVAGVDLIYLGLQLVLTSVDPAEKSIAAAQRDRERRSDGREKSDG